MMLRHTWYGNEKGEQESTYVNQKGTSENVDQGQWSTLLWYEDLQPQPWHILNVFWIYFPNFRIMCIYYALQLSKKGAEQT